MNSCRLLPLALAASLALNACASSAAYDPGLSPAENQLRQSNARFTQTVAEGAGAGALLGGIAGLALGGRNRGQAALIGAGAGAALGGGAGYLVARNNLNRASTEAQFSDAIQQASADADAYRNSANASSQIASAADAEAAGLRASLRSQQITGAQYQAKLGHYRSDIAVMNKSAADALKEAAQIRQDLSIAPPAEQARLSGVANSLESSARQQEQSSARLSRVLAAS